MNQSMAPERLQAAATILAGMLANPVGFGKAAEFAKFAWENLEALEAAAPKYEVEPTDEEWREACRVDLPGNIWVRNVSREAYRLAKARSEASEKKC